MFWKDFKKYFKEEVLNSNLIRCYLLIDYVSQAPILENTGTHLHKVLGDDNVLTVKFAKVSGVATYCSDLYSTYKGITKNGIMVGLRRYQFFGKSFSLLYSLDYHLLVLHIEHFSLSRC